jgi:hypothetical protein
MTRAKGDVLESTAVLAERNLAFRATIQIVENRLWQSAARNRPKIFDADHAGRRDCTGCSGHRRFQYARFLKTG